MDYALELEKLLKVESLVDSLDQMFGTYERQNYAHRASASRPALMRIKHFLKDQHLSWRREAKNTLLDSADCNTLASITCMLAGRQGHDARVVRPDDITRYFHAMVTYEQNGSRLPFKVSGKSPPAGWIDLTTSDVERRLRFITPIIRLANSTRGLYSSNYKKISHKPL